MMVRFDQLVRASLVRIAVTARSALEQGERLTFWNEFFEIFGKKRCYVATFEELQETQDERR
jgi:hypothetical protein